MTKRSSMLGQKLNFGSSDLKWKGHKFPSFHTDHAPKYVCILCQLIPKISHLTTDVSLL